METWALEINAGYQAVLKEGQLQHPGAHYQNAAFKHLRLRARLPPTDVGNDAAENLLNAFVAHSMSATEAGGFVFLRFRALGSVPPNRSPSWQMHGAAKENETL